MLFTVLSSSHASSLSGWPGLERAEEVLDGKVGDMGDTAHMRRAAIERDILLHTRCLQMRPRNVSLLEALSVVMASSLDITPKSWQAALKVLHRFSPVWRPPREGCSGAGSRNCQSASIQCTVMPRKAFVSGRCPGIDGERETARRILQHGTHARLLLTEALVDVVSDGVCDGTLAPGTSG